MIKYPNLRQERKKKKLSCADMATVIGLKTKAGYNKKELGQVPFTVEEAKKISNVLRKSMDKLFASGKEMN